jgi:hypothetical protein
MIVAFSPSDCAAQYTKRRWEGSAARAAISAKEQSLENASAFRATEDFQGVKRPFLQPELDILQHSYVLQRHSVRH